MNVEEIRRAFSEQGELRETITRWRAYRVDLIERGRGPVPLAPGVVTLFHVIPAEAFTPGRFTQAWRMPANEKFSVYVPDGNSEQRYNADGFLCHGSVSRMLDAGLNGYTQLFRSGIIEYGFSHHYQPNTSAHPMVLGRVIEKEMVYCFQYANNRLRREGQTGAVYVGFSLVGIAGKSFYLSQTAMAWRDRREYEIRQEAFTSPEVYVDLSEPAESVPFAKTLRPLVDTLWQVGGLEQTPSIINGVWEPFARD